MLSSICVASAALAANPYAGAYGGNAYVSYSGSVNISESVLGYYSFNIDQFGRIKGGLNGAVDGSGNILWDTPNSLHLTNSVITNGVITGTSSTLGGSGIIINNRLAANFSVSDLVGSGKLNWVTPSTGGQYLNAVTFGNGRFVAVGYGGTVASSADGSNWVSIPAVTGRKELTDVAFGNGLFVVVGTNWLMTSASGTNWNLASTNYAFSSVVFGNGLFVAVGTNGSAFSSSDGTNWTTVAGAATGQSFTGIDCANGLFILFGSTGKFQTSANGSTWNAVQTNGTTALNGAAYAAGRWFIGGTTRLATFTSADGSSQTGTNISAGYAPYGVKSVVGVSNLFIAASTAGYPPMFSTNGLNWTFANGLADSIRSVAYGNNAFVAVGGYIQSSTDGRAWTIRTTNQPLAVQNKAFGPYGNYSDQSQFTDGLNRRREVRVGQGGVIEMRFLDYTNGVTDFTPVSSPTTNTLRRILVPFPQPQPLVVIGDKGTILQYDGGNDQWKPVPSPTTADLYDVVKYSTTTFVAVGSGGTILTSGAAGTNWTLRSSGTANNLYTVNYGSASSGYLFLAGGDNGTLVGSMDFGVTWSARTSGVTNRIMRVSVGDFIPSFYAFPESGSFFLNSTNGGTSWAVVPMGTPFKMNNGGLLEGGYSQTIQSGMGSGIYNTGPGGYYTAPSEPSFGSIAYGNGRFVLLGTTNTAVSTDGIHWTAGHTEIGNRFATYPKVITFGQGMFVAAGGYGLVESSVDGINWTIRNSNLTNADFNGITYGGGRFVAVGAGGVIYSSTNGLDWENYSFDNTGGTLNAVAYGAGRFVAVGFALGGNYISRTSTNGVDWVAGTSLFHVTSITYVHDRFIATGTSFPIYVSTNGVSWWQGQGQSVNVNGNAFAYAGGRYVGVGDRATFGDGGVIESSVDTTNWYAETVAGSGNLRAALAANGQLVIAGDNGMVLTSAYVETNNPALLTGQPTPASQTVSGGTTVIYTATATGTGPLTYRWLKNGAPLFDGSGVSGATTATLTLTGVNALAAGNYQLSVVNDCGSDLSQPVSLAVAAAPVFALQPQNTTVTNLAFTNLMTTVVSATPLSFQWYLNNVPVTNGAGGGVFGATACTIYFKPALRTNEGDYYLVAANNYGAVTSSIVHLAVLRGPTITQLPVTVSPAPATNFLSPLLVFPGQTVSFGSTVDGTGPLGYQWRLNSNNIPDATNATLIVPNIQGAGSVTYSLAVTNPYGSFVTNTQFTIITAGTLRPDISFGNIRPILDVAALPDGSYLAGGWFENSTGAKLTKFSLASLSGGYLTNFLPVGDYDPGLRTIGVLSDNSVVVGGTFNATSGIATGYSNLVHFLPNGQFDTAFRPVNATTIQKVIPVAGGKFLALQAPDNATFAFIRRFNADGSVDGTFTQIASGTGGFWGLAVQSDGTIWFGANSVGLCKANADGTGVTVVDANVSAGKVFVAPDDRIYYAPAPAGGSQLRRRNADGSTNSFSVTLNNSLYAMAFLPSGKIMLGGNFTTINGTNAINLAMLNDDGSLNTGFSSPFAAIGGSINSILLLNDGSALLGTSAFNGVRRIQLYLPDLAIQTQPASLTVNRTATATFGVTTSGSSPVNYQWRFNGASISGATNATLTLTNVPDSAAGNYDVIVSNASGTNTSSIAILTVLGNVQFTLLPVGQSLLVGGSTNFTVAATGATPIAFQWRNNGTNIVGATSNVLSLANVGLSDIALYDVVASNPLGSITSAPAALSVYATTNGIGNIAGTIDTNYIPPILPAGSASVVSVVLDASNKVLITGSFTNFGGQPRTNFVRLNSDLSLDAATAMLNSAPVPAVGLTNGGFALGGYFSTASGATRYGLTFYDSAGTLLPQPVLSTSAYVDGGYGKNAFATQPDGKVLVGGYFTSVNGTACTNLARLNADGSLDASFVPAALNQAVTTVAVQPDGKILIAGYFTSVGGVAQAKVARLNADGSYDATFTNTFSISTPYGIKALAAGKILLFGQGLTSVGGVARNGIALLNTNGVLDTGFTNTLGGTQAILDVLPENDGRLVVVGSFTSVNGTNRGCIARLNSDGSLDPFFATGLGANSGALIYSVVRLPDGSYLVGGSFSSFDGVSRRGLVRLNGPPSPPPVRAILQSPLSQSVNVGDTAAFTVAATGTAPLTFQWRKNTTNILNATNVSFTISNVQTNDAASYDVIVTDNAGFATSQMATLTVITPSSFASWIAGFGISNGLTGAGDDADGDGWSNLAEYAFGTNPNLAGVGAFPAFTTVTNATQIYPAVQFTRNRSAFGVSIQVTAGLALDFAAPVATQQTIVDLGGGLDFVTIQSLLPISDYPAQFIKTRIVQP